MFCGHLLTTLVGGGRPPSWTTGRTFFSMRFATEEQDMRGKCQMVNLMHISTHITSYEIFREEVDCVEGQEGGAK